MTLPFTTVIIARDPRQAPSDLEVQLRPKCQRQRVVESLVSGKAHVLLPSSGATIAVRAYDQDDIQKLEVTQSYEQAVSRIKQWHRTPSEESASSALKSDSDLDGLEAFRDAFKYPIVFFILPPGETQRSQLSRSDSFVNRVQFLMLPPEEHPGSPRVYIVPSVSDAINTLESTVQSFKQEKRNNRQRFFEMQEAENFLPDPQTGVLPSPNRASDYVADAILRWAERAGIPHGDIDVLVSLLGTLSKLASVDSTALENVPINESTKIALLQFFGSADHRTPDASTLPRGGIGQVEAYDTIPVSINVPPLVVPQEPNQLESGMPGAFPADWRQMNDGVDVVSFGSRHTPNHPQLPSVYSPRQLPSPSYSMRPPHQDDSGSRMSRGRNRGLRLPPRRRNSPVAPTMSNNYVRHRPVSSTQADPTRPRTYYR